MPPGNRLRGSDRLARGPTGALVFGSETARLQCKCSPGRGRGLFALNAVPKGVAVCTLPGTLVCCDEVPETAHELFQAGADKFLVLEAPTLEHAGNLCNTADKTAGEVNNCRLVYKHGNSYVTLVTTRPVRAGQELLAPYGRGYTARLHREHRESEEAAPAEAHRGASGAASWTTCGVCGAKVRCKRVGQHTALCKSVAKRCQVSDETLHRAPAP